MIKDNKTSDIQNTKIVVINQFALNSKNCPVHVVHHSPVHHMGH